MRIIGDASVHQRHIVEASTNAYDYMRELEVEVTRLQEALVKWQAVAPHHRGECLFLTVGADGCTCGLDEARRMTRAALAPDTERFPDGATLADWGAWRPTAVPDTED